MTTGRFAALVLSLVAWPAALCAESVPPSDDCSRIAGVPAFLDSLDDAVAARDVESLVHLASDAIELDFGGGSGVALLRERLGDPEYRLWEEIAKLRKLGCASTLDTTISLPAFYTYDIGERDPFTAAIVLGEDVPFYAGAAGDTQLRRLGWEIVEIRSFNEADDSQPSRAAIILTDGTEGFVASEAVRSVIDYRLIAELKDGKWQIAALIAGD